MLCWGAAGQHAADCNILGAPEKGREWRGAARGDCTPRAAAGCCWPRGASANLGSWVVAPGSVPPVGGRLAQLAKTLKNQ